MKPPAALTSSASVEWYTPSRYVEAARAVLGGIDLDPASSFEAQKTVKARHYFATANGKDGLAEEWSGRVWLNPPYGKGIGVWIDRHGNVFVYLGDDVEAFARHFRPFGLILQGVGP